MPSSDFDELEASPAGVPEDQDPLTIPQAIANLQSSDYGLRYYASWWLGRFRVKTPEALAGLIATLSDESDRTPDGGYPLRRNSARALGKLGDRRAVPALLECLSCPDYYVREAAVQALGMLGDAVAIPHIMGLLQGGLEAAQPIVGCPHLAEPYDATLEALGSLNAKNAIPLIEPFLEHPQELVQYSAARSLYQLTQQNSYGDRLIKALQGEKLQLRRAALADLGAIGYLNAAEPISETLAENSLKLISLKGLLEHEVHSNGLSPLSRGAVKVMTLMDLLL